MSIDQWYVHGNKNDISSFHFDFMLVFFSRNVGLSSCYVDANHVMKLRFHRSDFSSYQMTPNLYLKGEIRISTKIIKMLLFHHHILYHISIIDFSTCPLFILEIGELQYKEHHIKFSLSSNSQTVIKII